ncbi:MAG: hypothetical protein ABSE77_03160 [Acidimicrobiales bacterium]|jgi:hypothetical protein
MAHGKWFSVDRIAAAVAANRSPQHVSLYGAPTVEVLAGTLETVRPPQHRRGRRAPVPTEEHQTPHDGDQASPELDLTSL